MTSLVLLHGFAGAPEVWDAVRAALRGGASVHPPACLGHGEARDVEADGFDAEVDRLARGIEAATDAPRVVAGYSMGGRLALGVAARHPHLVARVVAIGAHPGLEDPREREARRDGDEAWAHRLETGGIEAFIEAWEAQAIFATQARVDRAARDAQRRIRASQSPAGLARSLRTCGLGAMPPLLGRLAELALPIDLVVGAEDPKFLGVAAVFRSRVPRARLAVVPGAGHNVPLEAPEALARILDTATQAP